MLQPGNGSVRTRFSALAVVIVLTLGAVAVAQSGDAGLASIRADALRGHVFFLAAPEMGGRDSLSLEGRIAANYIAGFFYRLGLKPVGDGGTYFQNFPMTQAVIDRAQTRLRATITSGEAGTTVRDFTLASDFTLARQGGVDVDVTAPLVFAGYGIDAPEYGYNDYAGFDVAGKSRADPRARAAGRRSATAASRARGTPSTPTQHGSQRWPVAWAPKACSSCKDRRGVRSGRRAARPTARSAPTGPTTR